MNKLIHIFVGEINFENKMQLIPNHPVEMRDFIDKFSESCRNIRRNSVFSQEGLDEDINSLEKSIIENPTLVSSFFYQLSIYGNYTHVLGYIFPTRATGGRTSFTTHCMLIPRSYLSHLNSFLSLPLNKQLQYNTTNVFKKISEIRLACDNIEQVLLGLKEDEQYNFEPYQNGPLKIYNNTQWSDLLALHECEIENIKKFVERHLFDHLDSFYKSLKTNIFNLEDKFNTVRARVDELNQLNNQLNNQNITSELSSLEAPEKILQTIHERLEEAKSLQNNETNTKKQLLECFHKDLQDTLSKMLLVDQETFLYTERLQEISRQINPLLAAIKQCDPYLSSLSEKITQMKRRRAELEAQEKLRAELKAQEKLRAELEAQEKLRAELKAQEKLPAGPEAQKKPQVEGEAQKKPQEEISQVEGEDKKLRELPRNLDAAPPSGKNYIILLIFVVLSLIAISKVLIFILPKTPPEEISNAKVDFPPIQNMERGFAFEVATKIKSQLNNGSYQESFRYIKQEFSKDLLPKDREYILSALLPTLLNKVDNYITVGLTEPEITVPSIDIMYHFISEWIAIYQTYSINPACKLLINKMNSLLDMIDRWARETVDPLTPELAQIKRAVLELKKTRSRGKTTNHSSTRKTNLSHQ